MTALLEARNLTVKFGTVIADDDVTLTVNEGALVGLIGPNGAGKTTLIDALTGFVRATGSIQFRGEELTGLPAHARARRGLARTWQSVELFSDLTVLENMLTAAEPLTARRTLRQLIWPQSASDLRAAMLDRLHAVGLGDVADAFPSELSTGQRNLVGVARALASNSALVLLDEPAAGLDSTESEELGHRLRGMVDHGATMLLVDHDMSLVLSVCDYIYVLDFGRLIAQGTPAEVVADQRVIDAYLGTVDDDDDDVAVAAPTKGSPDVH